MFQSIKAMAVAMVVAAGLAGTASASDYKAGYKAVTTYETVYVDVVKSVPFEKTITKYDHCGKPYCVTITCYKDITVQVAKQVCVTKWVKICY